MQTVTTQFRSALFGEVLYCSKRGQHCLANAQQRSFFRAPVPKYFLHFIKVGTLDWARSLQMPPQRPVPAKACLISSALAELTRHRPLVDTGRLVVIPRKLPSKRVTVDCGKSFLLF